MHTTFRSSPAATPRSELPVRIEHHHAVLNGAANVPVGALGLVLVAHCDATAHLKPRNRFLAQRFALQGLGVLQVALVTEREESCRPGDFQEHNLGLMAERLANTVLWARQQPTWRGLTIGCLGFGYGGTAALMAAGSLASGIDAVAAVDPQLELAGDRVGFVRAATLLILSDTQDVQRHMNEAMFSNLQCEKSLEVLRDTTVLADGEALEQVSICATRWFRPHLRPPRAASLATARI